MKAKVISLKYAGSCCECQAALPAGEQARWFGNGRVACVSHEGKDLYAGSTPVQRMAKVEPVGEPRAFKNLYSGKDDVWYPESPVGKGGGGYYFIRCENRAIHLGFGDISGDYGSAEEAFTARAALMAKFAHASPELTVVRAPCVFSDNESHIVIEEVQS